MSYTQQANSISTRGMSCSAVGIHTVGMLCYTVEIIETPSGGSGDPRRPSKSSGLLPKYNPKVNRPPKTVTVNVYAYGQIYTETIMVDPDVEVTLDNIEVIDGDDGLVINFVNLNIN